MDFVDKACIVTGANTGLGFEVAQRLAARGADTTLLCRSRRKGEEAVAHIRGTYPSASVDLAACDLSSLSSIRDFMEGYRERRRKLDLLYNNAAVMKSERTETEDGFETMFQVNYLAPFILMTSLLDLLKEGTSPFVVNNGRPSYKLRLDMDDLQFKQKYSMYRSFFLTKLCLLFATLELARRQERGGVTVTMIDPGPFKSELVRDKRLMGWFKNLVSAPVETAAENILFHINPEEAEAKHGRVFKERKGHPLSDYWADRDHGARLWSITEEMLEGTAHSFDGRHPGSA
jgi:NAD(P)-dependent dehydrogenase (short-subunit alcohol dehydrogenase family)